MHGIGMPASSLPPLEPCVLPPVVSPPVLPPELPLVSLPVDPPFVSPADVPFATPPVEPPPFDELVFAAPFVAPPPLELPMLTPVLPVAPLLPALSPVLGAWLSLTSESEEQPLAAAMANISPSTLSALFIPLLHSRERGRTGRVGRALDAGSPAYCRNIRRLC